MAFIPPPPQQFKLKREYFGSRHYLTKCALQNKLLNQNFVILESFFFSGEVTSYTDTSYCIHILWEVCRSFFFWATLYNLVSQTCCHFDVPVHVWICPEAWTWDWDKISNRMRRLHYCFGGVLWKVKTISPSDLPSKYKAKIMLMGRVANHGLWTHTCLYTNFLLQLFPPTPVGGGGGVGVGGITLIWELTGLWDSKGGSELIPQFLVYTLFSLPPKFPHLYQFETYWHQPMKYTIPCIRMIECEEMDPAPHPTTF